MLKRHFFQILAAILLAIGASTAAAGSAHAGTPILYNQYGDYVPMRPAPTTQVYVRVWSRNSTQFRMTCWTYGERTYGNYSSDVWFYGQTYATGSWGYVHSSQVYYQWTVPRC
jgi:hypothetical protein